MSISDKIKEFRILNNLTQDDVAQACYVTRSTVSNWEAGRRLPDIETVIVLAHLFNVSVNDLLCDEEINLAKAESFKNQVYEMKEPQTKASKGRGIFLLILIAIIAIIIPLNFKENGDELKVDNVHEINQTSYLLKVNCNGNVLTENFKELNQTTLSHTITKFKIEMNTYDVQEAYVANDVEVDFNNKDKNLEIVALVDIKLINNFATNISTDKICSHNNNLSIDQATSKPFILNEGTYDFLLFIIDDSFYIGAFLVE